MTVAAAASPATVEASIIRVIAEAVALDEPGQHLASCSLVGLSAWSPSFSMQSASGASVSTRATLSIVPLIRPLPAARIAVGSPRALDARSTASRWSSSSASTAAASSSSVAAGTTGRAARAPAAASSSDSRSGNAIGPEPPARRKSARLWHPGHGHRGARRRQQGLRQRLPGDLRPQPRHRRQRVPRARRSVRAAGSRRRCGWSPGWRRSRAASCGSATGSSTTSSRRTGTSRWCSRTTRCTRT